ncbi:unnamed protein product [Gongylonema pulchrum]|uniref:RING-type domain-containing protein n=1 Tax=Gongylonema pulchrum TaxID=637853 RepID=A0A183E8Y9_9BILA|nr:unnamed protein product [Gongylonema pulchrum]
MAHMTGRGGGGGGGSRGSKPEVRKDYTHLLHAEPSRKDHAGIKFEGSAVAECDICCRESDLFAVGACMHPVCIECGIRLRVLCGNETCPKCRATVDTDWKHRVLAHAYRSNSSVESQRDNSIHFYAFLLCSPIAPLQRAKT